MENTKELSNYEVRAILELNNKWFEAAKLLRELSKLEGDTEQEIANKLVLLNELLNKKNKTT